MTSGSLSVCITMQTVLIKTGKVPLGPLISCCLLDYVPAESLPTAVSLTGGKKLSLVFYHKCSELPKKPAVLCIG